MENEVLITSEQTPIEIALGIDEEGMTTARKLYAFLELDSSNYSRWCKSNITGNEFAEENVDYWAFVINDEWGGQATKDYKITAHFAKKLSVKGNSEKAEEAREYFTRLEEKVKQQVIDYSKLSPELQMFKDSFQDGAKEILLKMILQWRMKIMCDSTSMSRHRQVALFKEKIINSLPALQRNFPCNQNLKEENKQEIILLVANNP